jgi:hypothetical protein
VLEQISVDRLYYSACSRFSLGVKLGRRTEVEVEGEMRYKKRDSGERKEKL